MESWTGSLWAGVLGLALLCGAEVRAGERTVVLLLFDGFAPSLVDRFATPVLDRMRREGAWSHRMDPAFPSVSLINGVTISTGCWPENHGIVTNRFLDPERGLYDHSVDADWLTGCEHLHQAAERQGIRAATLGWYGRVSESRGPLASEMPDEASYEDYPDDLGRAGQVAELLGRPPAKRPRLVLAYFKGPDAAAHFSGMESEETGKAVARADAAIGRVLSAIQVQPDAPDIALLVTTDHGMLPVETVVNVMRILRRHDIPARAVSSGTTSFLYFDDPGAVDAAFASLSGYREFDVVRREAQPDDWHLGSGPRVGELILSAHPPYFIEDLESWPWFLRWLGYVGPDFLDASATIQASHGYPTGTPGVEGIFYAVGSGIAEAQRVASIRAVDVHPTVMHLLGAAPGEPVDGVVAEAVLAPSGEAEPAAGQSTSVPSKAMASGRQR